jgi:uncharacterized protein YndB with AHSA1/START domain
MASRVLVALRVKASPQRAFEAFTAEIGQWWRPNPLFRFTPRSPGVLGFEFDAKGRGLRLVETLPNGKVFEVGLVRIWQPGAKVAFGWRQATFEPDQMTEVEVTFEAVGDETRVSVTHTGWDSVPADHLARHHFPDQVFLQRHGEWWRDLLGSYRVRVE